MTVGFACDVDAMQIRVSVNGHFEEREKLIMSRFPVTKPEGHVFDLSPEAVKESIYAALSGFRGTVCNNLGEVPFKYAAPVGDYKSCVQFAIQGFPLKSRCQIPHSYYVCEREVFDI